MMNPVRTTPKAGNRLTRDVRKTAIQPEALQNINLNSFNEEV